MRLHLQRAIGAGGIHAPVAAAKEVVKEATGTAPAEARTGQPKRTAALGDQQEAPLDHVVAAAVDLSHIGAVIAHPLQRRTGRCIQHQFAGGQLRGEIQPHHHAYALLHIRCLVIDNGFDERHRITVGTGHGSGIHLQGQRCGAYAAHLQARHHQCTATPWRECHAIQIALLHAAIAPRYLAAAGLPAEVEVGAQRCEVRGALVALDIERDRVAHRDAVAVQPRTRLRPGQQRQPQQQCRQYLSGPVPVHVDRPRHRPSLFLRSFSSWNLARSNAPGSSGTRRIHASTACCSSRWRGVVPSLPGTGLPS